MKPLFAFALGVLVAFAVQCVGRGPIVEIPTAVTSVSSFEAEKLDGFDFEITVTHERLNDNHRQQVNRGEAVGPSLVASGDVDVSDLVLDTPRLPGIFGEGVGGGSFTIAGLTVTTPPPAIMLFYWAGVVCLGAGALIFGFSKGRMWKTSALVGGLGGLFVTAGVLVNTYPVVFLVLGSALTILGLVWGYKAVVANREHRALGAVVRGVDDAEHADEEIADYVKDYIRKRMEYEDDFEALDGAVDGFKRI